MINKFINLLFLLSLLSCNEVISMINVAKQNVADVFVEELVKVTDLFEPGSKNSIEAMAIDDKKNIYLVGSFSGELDGMVSEGLDTFLIKKNQKNEVLWKIHFNSLLPQISASDNDDVATTIVWSQKDRSIFIAGNTKSSFIEGNNLNNDIFYAKINESGTIQWIRHIGATTSLTSQANDQAGFLKIATDHHLLLTFQTTGSLFEPTAGATDIGLIRINSDTGTILNARQLGQTTLDNWGTLNSITVDGSGAQGITQGNFDLDGERIVIPFRTNGSLIESNSAPASYDAAFVVLNSDLSIYHLQHLGQESYDAWVSKGNFAGDISSSNQVRSVVVLAANDYLFYGKTSGDFAAVSAGSEDLFFSRYQNQELISLTQLGSETLPLAIAAEQARDIYMDKDGTIYCNGHTTSDLLNGSNINYRAFIIKVDHNGNFLSALQFNDNAANNELVINFAVSSNNFIFSNGGIILGVNNSAVGTSNLNSYIWKVLKP